MAGIKETKEVLNFALCLANALGLSLQDGKVDIGDVVNFFDVLKSAPAAFMNLDQLTTELMDMDKNEKDELINFAKSKFDIPQKNVEKILENALDLTARLYDLIKEMTD